MKRIRFLVIMGALVVFGVAGAMVHADRRNDDQRISARLRALNEVPPNTSRATAEFAGTINSDETQISYTLRWEGLTGPPLFSHIHFAPPKINGGVMVFLCVAPGGTAPAGTPACPQTTSGEVSGVVTAANIVGPTAQGIDPAPAGKFADVVRAIRTGNAYANLHTPKYPGGEIRGIVVVHRERHDDDDRDDGGDRGEDHETR